MKFVEKKEYAVHYQKSRCRNVSQLLEVTILQQRFFSKSKF